MLQQLTTSLGAEAWCNTVVAFTHAADVQGGGGGPSSWQAVTKQREHTLQLMIRQVSGQPPLL